MPHSHACAFSAAASSTPALVEALRSSGRASAESQRRVFALTVAGERRELQAADEASARCSRICLLLARAHRFLAGVDLAVSAVAVAVESEVGVVAAIALGLSSAERMIVTVAVALGEAVVVALVLVVGATLEVAVVAAVAAAAAAVAAAALAAARNACSVCGAASSGGGGALWR